MCTLCLCDMGELHDDWLRAVQVSVSGPMRSASAVALPASAVRAADEPARLVTQASVDIAEAA